MSRLVALLQISALNDNNTRRNRNQDLGKNRNMKRLLNLMIAVVSQIKKNTKLDVEVGLQS